MNNERREKKERTRRFQRESRKLLPKEEKVIEEQELKLLRKRYPRRKLRGKNFFREFDPGSG